jgi:hypothetical protein
MTRKLTWQRLTDDAHDGAFYRFAAYDLTATVWYDGFTGWHWETTAPEGGTRQGSTRRMTEAKMAAVENLQNFLTAYGVAIPQIRPRKVGCWFTV